VLKLSEGVTDAAAEATVASYVVTPQLVAAFDQALGVIGSAVEGGRSAACYLHGSFGSGKSHFMPVLNLLLAGNRRARSIVELAGPVNKHGRWLGEKRFLMVPFHMIGARDVESAVLGGYADHVRRIHPGAPVPGFYPGERLFADALRLRAGIGDAAFFAQLNGGAAAEAGDGWGDLGADWDGAAFDAAVQESPQGEARQRLVGDLIGTFFGSYADVAATRGEAFVDLDLGLAIIAATPRRSATTPWCCSSTSSSCDSRPARPTWISSPPRVPSCRSWWKRSTPTGRCRSCRSWRASAIFASWWATARPARCNCNCFARHVRAAPAARRQHEGGGGRIARSDARAPLSRAPDLRRGTAACRAPQGFGARASGGAAAGPADAGRRRRTA